jgi:hypothetical protein
MRTMTIVGKHQRPARAAEGGVRTDDLEGGCTRPRRTKIDMVGLRCSINEC